MVKKRGRGKPQILTLTAATRRNRPLFNSLRYVADLSVVDFRRYFANQLRDLFPFDEEYALSWFTEGILMHCAPPDDDLFWAVVHGAEQREMRGGRALDYIREVFHLGAKQPDGTPWPEGWSTAATNLFAACRVMRNDCRFQLSRLSREREEVWHRGHEACPLHDQRPCWESMHQCGLTGMVHADGVRERWVQDAIEHLRSLQRGHHAQYERATRTLQAVGEMLWKVGSGDESERSEAERVATKDRQGRIHSAKRTLLRRFKTWLRVYKGDRLLAYSESIGGVLGEDLGEDHGTDQEPAISKTLTRLDPREREEALWRFAFQASGFVPARKRKVSQRAPRGK